MEKKVFMAGLVLLISSGLFAQFNANDPEATMPKGKYEFSVSTDDLKNALDPGFNDLGKSSGFDKALNDFVNSSAKENESVEAGNQKKIPEEE